MIYVDKATALEIGMTHEGTLYGMPAWLAKSGDNFNATPKFPITIAWIWPVDRLYDLVSYFMREDQWMETPIRMTRAISDME